MTLDIKRPASSKNKNKTIWGKTIPLQWTTFWNELPRHFKETISATILKVKLKKDILDNY